MILLIISLFLHCDLFSCVDYEKSKFDETAILKQHHNNYLEVKTFIKEAQKKFHKDSRPPSVNYPQNTKKDTQSRQNTSSIDLNQHTLRFNPFARARPSFPDSITPYTTELNSHYLKWDDIYPLITTRKTVQRLSDPKVPSTGRIPSHTTSKMTLTGPNYQKRLVPSLFPGELRLHMNHIVSSTLKSWSNAKPSSKTVKQSVKNQKSSKIYRPTTANFQGCTRSHRNSTFPASLRGHSGKGSLRLYITRNEEYKTEWLREMTTYTPVESWFLTLANKIGLTPNFSLSSKHSPQLGSTPSKTQVSAPRKRLMTNPEHQGQLRNGILIPKTATKVDDYSVSNTKKVKFFIEDQGGILHLRTVPEMDERQTSTVGKGSVTVANDVNMKITATTAHMLRREQEPVAFKPPLNKKSRRIQLKPKRKRHYDRKRHRYHRHKNMARQRYQRHLYRHAKFRYKDVDTRREQAAEEYSSLGRENREPSSSLQFYKYINTEDENLSKLIKTQNETRRREQARKDFVNQVKETLKQAGSKKKAKRLKKKAEILRKIVEGSTYSDEEESLRKKLVQALQNGSRT